MTDCGCVMVRFALYRSLTFYCVSVNDDDGSDGYKYRRFRLNSLEPIGNTFFFFSVRCGLQKGIVSTIDDKKSHHTEI